MLHRFTLQRFRLPRALLVASLCAGLAVALHTFGASSLPGAPARRPLPEGSTAGRTRAAAVPATVPAATRAPARASCLHAWDYFDNPRLRYGICFPPGWGWTDFTQTAPSERIPVAQLENLHLLSADAFPWTLGRRSFEAIRAGAIDVELDLLPPRVRASGECEPSAPARAGARGPLSCEQTYDTIGRPSRAGPLHALKVVVPLRDPTHVGARLLVVVRTTLARHRKEARLEWQVVRSIRPY